MGRREARAARMRDEARGVDTRTGELPDYPCPPHLRHPCVVEAWLSAEELDAMSEGDAMARAWCRWRREREAYARAARGDVTHLQHVVSELCGPGGGPVWSEALAERPRR